MEKLKKMATVGYNEYYTISHSVTPTAYIVTNFYNNTITIIYFLKTYKQ